MTVIIIDATYWAHLGNAVSPRLTRSDGHPIGATYGFMRKLSRFLFDPPCPFTHVVAVFDAGGKTWRHEYQPTYKANRVAPGGPTESGKRLYAQWPLIYAATAALCVTAIKMHGVEADDIVATLARRVCAAEDVVVVSADKDLLQLVEAPRVRVYDPYMPAGGRRPRGWMDDAAVLGRFGVAPRQIPDFLALIGDSADNIPGLPGVGNKRAAAVLRKYATVEDAIAVGAVLYAHNTDLIEQVRRSKHVATLSPHIQITESLDDLVWRYDPARAAEFAAEQEFKSLIPALLQQQGTPA